MVRITSRFGAHTRASAVVANEDLTGRRVVITGGASGIGVETARALAGAGADVTLAVRDLAAGEAAAEDIRKSALGLLDVRPIDLANLASVAAFAEGWGDEPLDILINNAGVMACPLAYTEDDLEMQIGVNHFGHFLLTALLARALMNAAEEGRAARVVQLSSIGHRRSPMNFDDPHYRNRPYDKWEAYGQSKTANSLFAVAFNERFQDAGINANAVMPGGIMTALQRHLEKDEMVAMGWMDAQGALRAGFKTPEQGAATSVWAAVSEDLEEVGGLYLEDCAEAKPFSPDDPTHGVMPHALDFEASERLWALSEETVGIRL